MSDIFISYARSTERQAKQIEAALRGLGLAVWRDDELPAHRAYADVIEEQLKAAKAVVVIWSAEAAKSQWVRAEADLARQAGTLVQLRIDGATPPLPFNQIQCADLAGWEGDLDAPGWRKVVSSIGDLVGATAGPQPPTVAAPPPLPNKPSIAVMPFANLSGDPDQEYFADGIMAEITTALGRAKSIFVIASNSTLSYKGKVTRPQDVGRELGVRFVMEGSIRKAANRVRIAVQLIDASDGSHLWSDTFDDELSDIFALQDRVALSVAGVIEPSVLASEFRRASKRPTENMGSYDLYLRAIPLALMYNKADCLAALALLNRALALDPDNTYALVVAAACHAEIVSSVWESDLTVHRQQAIDLAQRALRLEGEDPFVLSFAADALAQAGEDLSMTLGLATRATELNPGSSFAWFEAGWMRIVIGDVERGIIDLETAARLDPVSFLRGNQLSWLGVARFTQRRFEQAAALLMEATQLHASYPINAPVLAACHGWLGNSPAAREALARHHAVSPTPIPVFAYWVFRDPENRQLFLDGIARAEGNAAA